MDSLKGKKIWLIGCSFGIGHALAKSLAQDGALLALSARSQEKIEHLRMSLDGSNHLSLPMDVTKPESMSATWQAIVQAWGLIDILIYNAGTYEPMGADHFDLLKVEEMVDINFRGALRALDAVIPSFIKRQAGHIVLVASVAGYCGLPKAIGYGASKAALLHLAENLRLDLRRYQIKVQVVSPGFVKTRLTEKNSFSMPYMITPEAAALNIKEGMTRDGFDIHFPKRLSIPLKILRCLPYALYFRLLKNM